MERLTSNKSVSEMGMYELAHNSCYAKDGKARVRDFENDFDAKKLAIKLLEKYADIPNEFTCDDDFDDFMLDSLQYGTDDIQGLIAVFYRNLWAMADLRERLKKYEDLEEEGKLLKLPCAVGDTVYVLRLDNAAYMMNNEKVWEIVEDRFEIRYFDCIGKTVFLTRKEAEQALKDLEGESV